MFSVLSPLALFAGLGILIPLLIHLWNIKSGKTLKIGSIAFLGDPSNQRSSSLRITDWPLLLLRCLLILCIALILAAPVYQAKLSAAERPGWILVEKSEFRNLWSKQRKQLDSLLAKGYEIHDFDVNFRKLELADTISVFSTSAEAPLTYFALLKQLEAQLEPGRKVYLYVHNLATRFASKSPALHLDLYWNLLPAVRRDTSWDSGTYRTIDQLIVRSTAHSSAAGTYYKTERMRTMDTAGYQIDTAAIQVQFYDDHGDTDGRYVRAAVGALRQYTRRRIELRGIGNLQESKPNALVFWLSGKAPAATEISRLPQGTRLFQYAGGQVQSVASNIKDHNGVALEQSELYKRIAHGNSAGRAIWSDASGAPVLNMETVQGKQVYKFYSRFRPDWNNLVWSDNMVLFLLPMVLPEANATAAFKQDRRSLAELLNPKFRDTEQRTKTAPVVYVQKSISSWFWWVAFLLLILERWLSYRRNLRLG
jgi:hypothetical protein